MVPQNTNILMHKLWRLMTHIYLVFYLSLHVLVRCEKNEGSIMFWRSLAWHFCILPKHGWAWRKLFSSMYCSAKVLIVRGMRGSRQRVDISQERGDRPPFQEMGINHPHHNLSKESLQTERCTIKKWCTKRHSHYNLFKESLKTVRCTIKNDER